MPARLDLRAELRQRLMSGCSVIVVSMRRDGKTWLGRRIEEDALEHGYNAVFCDVQGCSNEQEMFKLLIGELEKEASVASQVRSKATNIFRSIVSGRADGASFKELMLRPDWPEAVETLLGAMNKEHQPWVIIVDELPLMVMAMLRSDKEATRTFLNRLRSLRLKFKNVRWLITGSVGLDPIARRENLLGSINDLERCSLPMLSAAEARELVDDEAAAGRCRHKYRLSDCGLDFLVQELGRLSPYYVEKLAHMIKPTGSGAPPQATAQDIRAAFEALLDRVQRPYFSAWHEHIELNFDAPERGRYMRILSRLSMTPEGEQFDTLLQLFGHEPEMKKRQLRDQLDLLISDGYLHEVGGRFQFQSGLLRRWWQRHMSDED